MVIISNFIVKQEIGKGVLSVWSEETHICPSCKKEELRCIGRRIRRVIELDGRVNQYLIWRLQCPCCRRIHHELPNFIVPYKRYSIHVISEIIEGDLEMVPCGNGAIKNILHWFMQFKTQVLSCLNNSGSDCNLNCYTYSPLEFSMSSLKISYWLKLVIHILANNDKWFTTQIMF